ncbi:MAG: phosphoenolpyruvate carboxylase, partial [Candidatus Limnocylindrales bacterium]
GEVVAARYGNVPIALRHLELLAGAVIAADARRRASVLVADQRLMGRFAAAASDAYRALVYDDPGFAAFFARITPIDVLTELRLGSRPASRRARGGGDAPIVDIERLRAIPWGFAWAQARIELPGWYGLGSAFERLPRAARERLTRLYRMWPFLAAIVDHAELALARTDLPVARRYASLATGTGDDARWASIDAEHARSVAAILSITGRSRLLEASPAIARQIELRNPDIHTLSELQVGRLARLRALPPESPERSALERLVRLTVSGVAAGLQVTG